MRVYGRPRFKDFSEPPPRPYGRHWKKRARQTWKRVVRAALKLGIGWRDA